MTDETQDQTQLTEENQGGDQVDPRQEPGEAGEVNQGEESNNNVNVEAGSELTINNVIDTVKEAGFKVEMTGQEYAQLRLKQIREKARNPNTLTYEEFEDFAEVVKEFLVKSDLLKNIENNIFFSLKIIKKDRDGFFKICGFVCQVNPEVIKTRPIVEVVDYMIVTNEFLEGVRILDFFTLTSTILTKLITV